MTTSHFFYFLWYTHIITESLPISSSGHLRLAYCLYNYFFAACASFISQAQEYIMHIPSACAFFLVLIHHVSFIGSLSDLIYIIFLIILANAITTTFYFIWRIIPAVRLPLYLGFLITACLLLSLYALTPGNRESLTLIDALTIGTIQGIALLPGISRLASTYVTGCWLGLIGPVALLFSYLLAFPLLLGGIAKGLYSTKSQTSILDLTPWRIFILVTVTVTAYMLLEVNFLLSHTQAFKYFGFYMFLPAICAFLLNCKESS